MSALAEGLGQAADHHQIILLTTPEMERTEDAARVITDEKYQDAFDALNNKGFKHVALMVPKAYDIPLQKFAMGKMGMDELREESSKIDSWTRTHHDIDTMARLVRHAHATGRDWMVTCVDDAASTLKALQAYGDQKVLIIGTTDVGMRNNPLDKWLNQSNVARVGIHEETPWFGENDIKRTWDVGDGRDPEPPYGRFYLDTGKFETQKQTVDISGLEKSLGNSAPATHTARAPAPSRDAMRR